MRAALPALGLLLLLAACAQTHETRAGGWRLVWSDEFEREGPPDPSRWGYEEGFVRNQEAQWYTRGRPENARVEDGLLIIEGRRERWPNPAHDPAAEGWKAQREAAEYTSASLITLGRASWLYGRVEVRARLPQGRGVWPAIWMMGSNRAQVGWPACGEIDVMEFVGKHPDRVHGTVHYPAEGGHRSNGGRIDTPAPYEDFHVYAVEWSAQRLDFFFDETLYHTFALDEAGPGEDNPFRRPHYLLINLALGGSWGGPIDDGVLPARYAIDWVRVYERVGGSGADPSGG